LFIRAAIAPVTGQRQHIAWQGARSRLKQRL
jgi:hypothetical protein